MIDRSLRITFLFALVAASLLLATSSYAQSGNGIPDIQKQLTALYPTAKATADGTDLVTAGAVLVLQKDHLQMCQVNQSMATPNFYKNGVIKQGGLAGLLKAINTLNRMENPGAAPMAIREFVTGEKFFVTRISTESDGVVFVLMSDPIKDQRYKATLKFPFPKGSTPSPDDVAAMIAEVVKIDSAGDAPEEQNSNEGGSSGGGATAPVATKTIAVGQTRDQVIASFGVPSKVVQLGKKEIDFFPDMKVTFVMNRVTNVE